MQPDPEAFADMVVMTVKAAMAPVLERLAVAEQSNRDLQARVLELSGLRDRVTVVETKSIGPVSSVPEAVSAFDPAPMTQRIDASDVRLKSLEDRVLELSGLRDRVTIVETKSALSHALPVRESVPTFDPTPLMQRIDATDALVTSLEARPVAVTDAALTERVLAVESRLQKAELIAEMKAGESAPILASLSDLAKDFGVIRERVAVVETRAQIPGPSGKDGADGTPGRDGVDGVGWDDLEVVQDDARSFTIKAARGERVKVLGTARFPVQIQQGVYVEGHTYVQGDVATFGGSQWHCDAETTTKPGESKDWTLVVKRGRDGKDGKDAPSPLPVVKR